MILNDGTQRLTLYSFSRARCVETNQETSTPSSDRKIIPGLQLSTM